MSRCTNSYVLYAADSDRMLYYMGCLYYSGAGSLHTRVSYRNSQPIETKTVTLVLGVIYLDRTRRTESGKRDRRGARSP